MRIPSVFRSFLITVKIAETVIVKRLKRIPTFFRFFRFFQAQKVLNYPPRTNVYSAGEQCGQNVSFSDGL